MVYFGDHVDWHFFQKRLAYLFTNSLSNTCKRQRNDKPSQLPVIVTEHAVNLFVNNKEKRVDQFHFDSNITYFWIPICYCQLRYLHSWDYAD